MAAVACANLLQYALQLLPRACSATPLLAVTPAQRQLLGLSDSDLGEPFMFFWKKERKDIFYLITTKKYK